MKIFRWRMTGLLRMCGAAAIFTGLGLVAGAQGEPEDVDPQANDVRVMARVLNDSLAPVLRKGNEERERESAPPPPLEDPFDMGHQGPIKGSPFDVRRPPVSGNYIPTVGAIFSVRVNFPLSEPPAPSEERPSQAEESSTDDLWQKNSQQRPMPGDMVQSIGMEGLPPEGLRELMGGGGEPQKYDPARVTDLREALVGAIAKYGHRMESLKDDERIVLVVSTRQPPSVFNIHKQAEMPRGDRSGNPRKVVVQRLGSRPPAGHDEIVLSFSKGDLKRELESKAIEGKMIERHVRGQSASGPPPVEGNPPPPPRRN